MLFYLFITLQIIRSISCDITCYDCPIDENNYNYFVTADGIPDTLNNCTTKKTDDICIIDLIWSRQPDSTQIGLSARDEGKSINPEQTFNTYVQLENKNNSFIWTRSISYTCSTNECNSLTVLKRLLSSLTLDDNLRDLQHILRREEPFNGTWCSFGANTTSFECATEIIHTDCKECSFQGFNYKGSLEVCENCLTFDIDETLLAHEVDFNMTDRTRIDHCIIQCRAEDCNTANNGELVRQKSTADFNFVKYFGDGNKSTTLSYMSKMVLIFVVIFMKYF